MFNNELWQKPAGGAGGGGFYSHQIASSLRNSQAQNGTLKITAGTPTSRKTFTYSWWWKRYDILSTGTQSSNVFCAGTSGGAYSFWTFTNGSTPQANFQFTGGNFVDSRLTTNMLFRDPSAWYHCVLRFDSTQATASNRVRLYVNGVEPTYASASVQTDLAQDEDVSFMNQSGVQQGWGGLSGKGTGAEGCDVQMAEIVFNDGQSYGPENYGETKNGVWIPKDPSGLTFGNNGYWLKMAAGAIGTDSSGNGNNFTVANIAAHDVMLDSPTFNSSSNGGNFMTYNGAYIGANNALAEGNLQSTGSSAGNNSGTFGMLTGKWYWECRAETVSAYAPTFGIGQSGSGGTDGQYYIITWQTAAGQMYGGGGYPKGMGTISVTSTGVTALSSGDILSFWLDCDNRKLWVGKNGTIPNSGNVATGANPQASWATTPTDRYFTATCQNAGSGVGVLNAGQNPSFNGALTGGDIGDNADKNGYGLFKYDPSGTDFIACCAANLPVADSIDPAQTDDNYPQKLFNTKLYTGTGSSNALTGVGFKPDWTWIKERGGANDHKLTDSTRGVTKAIESNTQVAQTTDSNGLTAFGTDGFTVGSDAVYNNSSDTYVAWNWRANSGTTASNGNGDIASVTQADPSGGFSIVTYTGSGTAGDTIGHGLSTTPDMIMIKNRSSVDSWAVYSSSLGNTIHLALDTDAAQVTSSAYWNSTSPTSSVFTVGTGDALNQNTKNYVAYCFANVEGHCKVGSYASNNTTDNTFVYLGFRPAFLLIKSVASGCHWQLIDNKRDGYNPQPESLDADRDNASRTNAAPFADLLSNGFKVRTDNQVMGSSSHNPYLYLAMAHNPFKYATAR